MYSVDQLAELFRVSKALIRNAIKHGHLRASRIGREYRVYGRHVTEWIEAGGSTQPGKGEEHA